MQHQRRKQRLSPNRPHAGLAPVELVLVLPILMMVAALLMFVTNAAVWKLRSHGAAREAAMQQVHPRWGEPTTSPPEWRRSDVSTTVFPGPPAWPNDPLTAHTLFRGPDWLGVPINTTLFDGSPGMVIGRSQADIRSGLWPQMRIRYQFQRDVSLFAGHQWQYDSMGLNGHGSRRSVELFNLP